MKKCLVFLVVIFMFVCSFNSNLFAEDVELHGSLNVGYFSHFVGGLTGAVIYDDPVLQQSVGITVESLGLYTKVWSSYSPESGFNKDFGDEVDYIIGIYRKIGKVGCDISYAFYNMYDMDDTTGDLHALALHLDLPEILFVNPYLTLEQDIPVDREILEGGFMYRAGVRYNASLPKSQVIVLDVSLGGHDGAFGKRPETISYAKLAVSSTFRLWKIDVTPMINFQKRLGYKVRGGGATESKIWYGLNCSLSF